MSIESIVHEGPTPLAYTIAQVTSVIPMSRAQFYRLVAQGHFELRKCGSKTLVSADSVSAYWRSLPAAKIGASEAA
jgi:hypothetical protein